MTENKTPAAAPCPDCRALVPATMADRSAHNDWHADLKSKHRGVQKRIRELAEIATRAVDAASSAKRAVESIEIPEQVEPMRIEEWPEDELPTQEDEDPDRGLADIGQNVVDAYASAADAYIAPAPAPQIDPSGLYTPHGGSYSPLPST